MKFNDLTLYLENDQTRITLDSLTKVIHWLVRPLEIQLTRAKASLDDLGLPVYDFWLSQSLPEKNLRALRGALKEFFKSDPRVEQYPEKAKDGYLLEIDLL